ncbi:MAG: hypothetical protein IV097_07840 [Burkholderiaceae bacterium]|nr:hypothetical protein [Burkholderiaceae bacterium]
MPSARPKILIVALALAAASTHAADLGDAFKLEGFGTLAAHAADDPVATMRTDARNPNGSRDGRWRLDGDSLASLQLTVNPDGELRGVAQWLAKDDLAKRMRPRTEWFYASWDAAPDWNLKLGRLVLPAFMLSDTRNVAFAQTTARPPTVLYGLNPISHLDGGSFAWRQPAWGGHLSLDGTAGRSQVKLALGELDLSRIAGISMRWSHNGTSLRAGHSTYRAAMNVPSLQRAMATLTGGSTACSNCAAVFAERAPGADFEGSLSAIGASFEQGHWQFQAEYAYRNSNTILVSKASAWYGLVAYRWLAWTPYLVLGAVRTHEPPLGLLTAAGAPPGATATQAAFEQFLRGQVDRRVLQLGLRWDLHDGLALKVQLERAHVNRDPVLGSTSVISFPLAPPVGDYTGPAFDGRVNMVSVNLDFVF